MAMRVSMSKINDFDGEWRAWPIVVVVIFIFIFVIFALFLIFVAFVQQKPLQTIPRSSPVSFVNNEQASPNPVDFKSREDLPDIRNILRMARRIGSKVCLWSPEEKLGACPTGKKREIRSGRSPGLILLP